MEVRSTFFCRHDAGSHSTSGSKVTKIIRYQTWQLCYWMLPVMRWLVQSCKRYIGFHNYGEANYQGGRVLNKQPTYMFTYTLKLCTHSLCEAYTPLLTLLINPSVQSGSCTALVFTASDSLQYNSLWRLVPLLTLLLMSDILASCFDELCWQIM